VRLPNGTELGYEANIDLKAPYFQPDAVLRAPTGEIIAKEVSPIHVTEKAAYGWAWPEEAGGDQDFRFIWMREFGLVREDHDPDLFKVLKTDPGDIYFGADENLNVNTLWLLKRLSEDARFRSETCSTQFVTW